MADLRWQIAHDVLPAVEERLGEGAGGLGLADASGAEENEGADEARGILTAGAGAYASAGDGWQGSLQGQARVRPGQ